MLLTVSVEVPLLDMVKVLCADVPTVTLPNARSPLKEIRGPEFTMFVALKLAASLIGAFIVTDEELLLPE
jgi:hypothetical protein